MYAAHTKLCESLEHLYRIQLAVKLWQEDADVSSILNNRLNEGLFCLEILLQHDMFLLSLAANSLQKGETPP